MQLAPINSIIKLVPNRPETTISLGQALQIPDTTVGTYFFTPYIQEVFEKILDSVGSSRGGGYWIQAEYGAGKTHFLSALSCLLMNTSEPLWNQIKNDQIKNNRHRLVGKKLFPVILSLKGEAGVDKPDNLLNVILDRIKEELDAKGLSEKISITTDDELISWYEERPSEVKNLIDVFIRKNSGKEAKNLDKKTLSSLINQYCVKNLGSPPQISSSTKKRIHHIYNQILNNNFNGVLFVIDEFEAWQRRHPVGSAESALDEEVLETLSWILPKDLGLEIFTIVASQMEAPAKLRGDRFYNVRLLNNEQDYDVIVAQRVRDLIPDNQPDVMQYYEHYKKEFKFMKSISKEYFSQIFPFQPRCFEVIRKITARALPTARIGIGVIYDCICTPTITDRSGLISISDLMSSEELIDALGTVSYRDAYNAYQDGLKSLDDFQLDNEEREIAKKLFTSLFLWHVAYIETPRPLTIHELTEATLTTGDVIKGEDFVEVVLFKLRELSQISYTKDKGARFIVTREGGVQPQRIFSEYKRKVIDESLILDAWEKGLILLPQYAAGEESLFSGYVLDERKKTTVEFRKIEYPGEVIVTKRWRSEYGEKITDDTHFRVIILTRPNDIDNSEIKDYRIAICVPTKLPEASFESARDYLTLTEMEKDYKDKTGTDAEEVRGWLISKRAEVIREMLRKQLGQYKSGEIITAHGLGIDEKKVFQLNKMDKILEQLIPVILSDAYAKPIVDSQAFLKIFSSREAKNIFEGLFKKATSPAAVSACRNYAIALKFSKADNPSHFTPSSNKVFEILEEKVKEEVQIWKILEELRAQGLTDELTALYILAFVYKTPNAEVSLKPSHKQQIQKISSSTLQKVEWRANVWNEFDTLYLTADIKWEDVLPFAKIINSDLKLATFHDEILNQERQLILSINDIKNQIPRIEENISILSTKLSESLPESKTKALNEIKTIFQAADYREFFNPFKDKERYPEVNTFKAVYEEFKKIQEVADHGTEIVTMKAYLDEMEIPEKDSLSGDCFSLKGQLNLSSFLNNPSLIGTIRERFKRLQESYTTRYQIYHRDYHKKIRKLRERLEDMNLKIAAVARLEAILDIGSSYGKVLETKYKNVDSKIMICANPDPVSVENMPFCQQCRLKLTSEVPDEEVEGIIKEVEKSLYSNAKKLSQALTKTILERDTGKQLDKLLKIIQVSDLIKLSETLTDELVKYIKQLFEEANIATESVGIISRLKDRFSYIDEENIEELLKAFREELQKAIDEAKKKHKGKKVRISLT